MEAAARPAPAAEAEERPGGLLIGLSLVGEGIVLLHRNAIVDSIAFVGRDEK